MLNRKILQVTHITFSSSEGSVDKEEIYKVNLKLRIGLFKIDLFVDNGKQNIFTSKLTKQHLQLWYKRVTNYLKTGKLFVCKSQGKSKEDFTRSTLLEILGSTQEVMKPGWSKKMEVSYFV